MKVTKRGNNFWLEGLNTDEFEFLTLLMAEDRQIGTPKCSFVTDGHPSTITALEVAITSESINKTRERMSKVITIHDDN